MEKTKAHLVSIYDANGNLPTLANGILSAFGDDGSGGTVNEDFKIRMSDIISSSFASTAAGTDQRDDVTVGSPNVGDVLVITLLRVDSRQNERKTFRHYVVAGDTANSIATAFRAQINDHGVYSAGGAGAVVEITLAGSPFVTTVSAGLTLAAGVAFAQAVGTPAAVAADGGVAGGTAYDVWEIEHYIDVRSNTLKKTSERSIVVSRIYTQQAPSDLIANFHSAAVDGLADMLDATYSTLGDYHDTGIGTVA